MTRHDLQILDTLETTDYMKGELSDDGLSRGDLVVNSQKTYLVFLRT